MSPCLQLLRPQQWIKNTFVFLAMFFGGRLLDVQCWVSSLVGFVAFCFAASAIYALNDVIDVAADRQSPAKRHRPVAAGSVSNRVALGLSVVCAAISLIICRVLLPIQSVFIIAAYLILNVLYCFLLKRLALIDIMIIAIGFVLRLAIGGIAANVELSVWIVIMVFLLAFFLAIAKRRQELVMGERNGDYNIRPSASGYTKSFIDMSLCILASVILIAYIIYTIQADVIMRLHAPYLYLTSVFVLCGILRYLQITVVDEDSGDPVESVINDRTLQISIVCWILSFVVIIYVL